MKSLKSWGVHAIASLLSVLAIVSQLPQGLDLFGPNTGKYVGAAGLLLTFIHGLQQLFSGGGSSAPAVQSKQGGFARPRMLLVLAAVSIALAGCTFLNSLMNNPVFVAGLQDAIEIAIGVIGDKYGAGTMTDIATWSGDIAGLASSDSNVTLAQLVTQADTIISAQHYNTDETAAFDSLVLLAAAGLSSGVNAAANANPQAVVNLQTFFTDIQTAAQNYSKTTAAAVKLEAALKR